MKAEKIAIKREPSRERSQLLVDDGSSDDDEVSVVSSSKRRKLAITVDDNGVETIDLT